MWIIQLVHCSFSVSATSTYPPSKVNWMLTNSILLLPSKSHCAGALYSFSQFWHYINMYVCMYVCIVQTHHTHVLHMQHTFIFCLTCSYFMLGSTAQKQNFFGYMWGEFFTGWLPLLSPNQKCQRIEWKAKNNTVLGQEACNVLAKFHYGFLQWL